MAKEEKKSVEAYTLFRIFKQTALYSETTFMQTLNYRSHLSLALSDSV